MTADLRTQYARYRVACAGYGIRPLAFEDYVDDAECRERREQALVYAAAFDMVQALVDFAEGRLAAKE